FTGDALQLDGFLVVVAELPLEHPVDAARALLLAKLIEVLALLRSAAPVLAGRERPLFDRAFGGVALRALEVELDLLAPAQAAIRVLIPCHYTRLRRGG